MADRTVAALFVLAMAALVLFASNVRLGFGFAACGLLVLSLALGFGRLRAGLIGLFAAYAILLSAMVWLEDSPRLVLGVPAATALLIYGIWPAPLAAGLLYGLVFRRDVLPDEKLDQFLAEHGRRRGPG
jgi:hypothetical protein